MLELGLTTLLSYLIGSLNGSLLLGSIIGGPDIRTVGSGNPGGTNALRVRGKWFALAVMLIDIGKGFLVVSYVPGAELTAVDPDAVLPSTVTTFAAAGAVIVGHCYPVWFGFSGGKGAATAVGVLMALSPVLLVPGVVTWVLVVVITGFVGLATMLAAAILPLFVIATGLQDGLERLVFLLLLALFILYTHRANVSRMMHGQENRMASLMIWRRHHRDSDESARRPDTASR